LWHGSRRFATRDKSLPAMTMARASALADLPSNGMRPSGSSIVCEKRMSSVSLKLL
jgi:hypothetical protein